MQPKHPESYSPLALALLQSAKGGTPFISAKLSREVPVSELKKAPTPTPVSELKKSPDAGLIQDNRPVRTDLSELQPQCCTYNVSKKYNDLESTPVTCITFKATFADGTLVQSQLDEKGMASFSGPANSSASIEFCFDETDESIQQQVDATLKELNEAMQNCATAMREDYKEIIAKQQIPPDNQVDARTRELRDQLRESVRKQIEELKARSQQYDSLSFLGKTWENIKATASGVGKGVTEYIPDFGELGDLLQIMDIDIAVLTEAMITGDTEALEKAFQEWKDRAGKGYKEASETMEIVILLISDEETRKILASLPQRFLAVTPTDELVEIGVAQGTQVGLDTGAVVGTTVIVGAVSGPGGAVAGTVTVVATTARKAAKALEAVAKILNKLAKALKKKRSKKAESLSGPDHQSQANIPKEKEKNKDEKEAKGDVYPYIVPLKNYEYIIAGEKARPGKIKIGIKELKAAKFNGSGQIRIKGDAKLFKDEKCTNAAPKTYNDKELRRGIELYVKYTKSNIIETKKINIDLILDGKLK